MDGLTVRCENSFGAGDRERGTGYWQSDAVSLFTVSRNSIGASVQGSATPYEVRIDLRALGDGVITCSCECPRWQDGFPCKHVWATLLELDTVRLFHEVGTEHLKVLMEDPGYIELDAPALTAREAKRREHGSSTSQTLAVSWQDHLQRIQNVVRQFSAPRKPSEQEQARSVRRWYVLDDTTAQPQSKFEIRIFHSARNADGEWLDPLPANHEEVAQARLVDHEDRLLGALLVPAENRWRSGISSDRFDVDCELVNVDASYAREAYHKLCETGRFVWSPRNDLTSADLTNADPTSADPTSAVRLSEFRAITFDGETNWQFLLHVVPGERDLEPQGIPSHESENPLLLCPILKRVNDRGEPERIGIEHIAAMCESGAMIHESRLGFIDPESLGWTIGWQRTGSLAVPREQLGPFLDLLHRGGRVPDLDIDHTLGIPVEMGLPNPVLRFRRQESGTYELSVEPIMRYGSAEVYPIHEQRTVWCTQSQQLFVRDFEAEARHLAIFDDTRYRPIGFHGQPVTPFGIRQSGFAQMVHDFNQAGWEVRADEQRFRATTDFQVAVSSGEDWFDLQGSVSFGGVSIDLPELLRAIQDRSDFVLLADGSQGMISEQWLRRFQRIIDAGEDVDHAIRFERNQALLLDLLLEEQQDVSRERDFSELCERLASWHEIEEEQESADFRGELRPYQRYGVGWFRFLRELRFGGCLADDMGLGKTVQVLAMLQDRCHAAMTGASETTCSLVVVPKSLVFNWMDEAARFTPELKLVDYTGPKRKKRLASQPDTDLIVTTYGTLRRDVTELKEVPFDYVILDEAQAIKNRESQAAKACRLMDANHRLAMTGTPIENHLGDLWSIFDFLNPGMIRNRPKTLTASGVNDDGQLKIINRALKPFILRRTKEEVLTELPSKTEQTLYCEMTPKQAKLYNELRDHYRAHLSGKIKQLGIKRSKIHVLEALLRLRQAACDPRLANNELGVVGAKIELLLEQLQEIIDGGHKVLVFSQFTSFLAIVREALEEAQIDYEYLDGKTRNRERRISNFQTNDDCSVFLISLKAGGYGLNLTAADYVFILDPWWNPAVEAQAIDRAHRIGQTKPVMAYRIIAKSTIEQKILDLQHSKRELADAVITGQESLISELSMDDVMSLLS